MRIPGDTSPPPNNTGPAVAFTASPTITRTYGPGQTILFDNLITSVGGGYSTATSFFTCPQDGVYAFHVSVYSQSGLKLHATIHHSSRGELVNALVDNTDESVSGNQSSNLVIVECLAGENVSVRAVGDIGQNLFVSFNYPSFSGYLIGSIP